MAQSTQPSQPSQPSVSPIAQLAFSGETHHNQRLFSDYYLDNILPQQWQESHVLRDEAASVKQQLTQRFASYTPNPNNEAQTEDDWIKPVLHTLGHLFEVQVPLQVPDSVQEPDYVFYRDEVARAANKGRVMTEESLRERAYAIGDAKRWERSLDKAVKAGKGGNSSDAFSNKNPSYQIFFYMLHSGLPWGILTNGRQWRLYHYQTAHKLEIFYEVDLPALLALDEVEPFLYFYAFFRRAAFESGPLSLDAMLAASTDYARSVSESLRQQVYDALRYVAQGFLDYAPNKLTPTPETCKAIYDNSLILLYRLLFIFYAEARDLLPIQDNKSYRLKYSLKSIKESVKSELSQGLLISTSSMYWARLKDLFRAIDKGSPPLNVTTFNGGLFDPTKHEFLERYTVGDVSLCNAIDKLARVNRQYVDYRDLAERHLGTIYEGLLEYTLRVADEPMVELRSSSKIVPASGVAKRDIAATFQAGEVYLVTDSGERKTTGSYYTPDYIVKYMVEQTLRPLLDSAIQSAHSDAERTQAVLAINVLDPSMGSGHFPVEVTEYIARYLVELGIRPEESGETIETTEAIETGGTRGTGEIREIDEADMTYWKRRVAQQCIYGVDLNPLAVELAKLSLWLVTVAKDRPLNFLDHHLRAGNALIGSWLEDIAADLHPKLRQTQKRVKQAEQAEAAAGQLALTLFDDADFRQHTHDALLSIAAIEQNPGVTVSDVKAQEAAYEELRARFSEKYRNLANLGVALYYNLNIQGDVWRPLTGYALHNTLDERMRQQQQQFSEWLDAANAFAEQRRLLHWELEFPNIFFGPDGQPLGERAGFDVVIGNPPYVRQEQLSADKPYYQDRYDVYHGKADLFVYFFGQGLKLLRDGGRLAYISSNSWLRADYATTLRQHLRTQTSVETIIDLGDNHVFADAPDMTPSIEIVQKVSPENENTAQVAVFARNEGIKTFKDQLVDKLFEVSIYDQHDKGWQLQENNSRYLFVKLMAVGNSLKETVHDKMFYGVKTGLNEAFIIDDTMREQLIRRDSLSANIIKPMLRGEDLRPWYQENEGRWLIFTRRGIDIEAYPAIKAHLQQFREQLEPRPDNWNTKISWHGRKPGPYKWYEIQDSIDYYDDFEKPKIFWAPIGKFPRYSWDEHGQFVNNAGFFLLPDHISLLGILQSRVSWFCTSRICTSLGERAGLVRYQQFIQFIEHLPIPTLTDEQRKHIGSLAQQLTDVERRRYEVRRRTAHRILRDLGNGPDAKLNQRLELWWELPFTEFRVEATKVFKRDIPLKERDDWEELLRERAQEIRALTDEIVRLETALNAAVYAVFELNDEEIALIERETKYAYGEW